MPLESRDEHGNGEGFAIPPDILDIFDHPGSFENVEVSNIAQKWYTHELYSKRGCSVCFPPQPCAHSSRFRSKRGLPPKIQQIRLRRGV
jgi:hypothetical protein